MNRSPLSRRQLLLVAVTLAMTSACATERSDFDRDVLDAYFDGRLSDAVDVGHAFLGAGWTMEPTTLALLTNGAREVGQALDALDRRVDADFGAGQVLVVEGWTMSETEIALCVLATRIDQDRA